MMRIVFCTDKYERSHGKAPRGRGCWGFQIEEDDHIVWEHGTLTEAKKKASGALQFRASELNYKPGALFVEVLP